MKISKYQNFFIAEQWTAKEETLIMDHWTKKKKAAEQCGGVGMARYIDSNEAKRIARLKNAKSSISSMTQHR